MLIKGKMELTIGDQTRVCESGEVFIIPADTLHIVKLVNEPVTVLDLFSSIREDYVALFNRYYREDR
jgi:quercetin dioxygenase-like cupin family protein